jgi:squalene-associated FAD-dependent desaturase
MRIKDYRSTALDEFTRDPVLTKPSSTTTSPLPKPPPPHVVIVGGGLAGLACASGLVGRGLRITLIESRPRLGGRASSFSDPATGELVDNCQHVSMACCTNLADFCRRVGIDGMLSRERELVFLSPDGKVSRFRAGLAPAPFHLTGSFLKAGFLSAGDKLRVAYGLAKLASGRDERAGESFADWLSRHRQSPRSISLFWSTVLVSALNERPDQMDVGHARKVFIDGFLRNRTGFQPELPLVPLGELYGMRLESWLGTNGVAVRHTTGVRAIEPDDDGAIRGVELRSGESVAADFVVLAVPFDRVRSLVPDSLSDRLPFLAQLDSLRAAPITGIHLWFDRPVCPFRHVVTPGRMIHWVFNHTAIQGRTAPAGAMSHQVGDAGESAPTAGAGQYLQVVISASYDLLSLDKAAVRDAVLGDLAEIWPAARAAKLVRWWVVTEHGATFAVRPGVEALRPSQRTPVDGLFLAGDWTDTGWPPTMEGAVRSGYLAAQGILAVLDRPTRLIRPGLKTGLLAGWLFGTAEYRPPRPLQDPPPGSPPGGAVSSDVASHPLAATSTARAASFKAR